MRQQDPHQKDRLAPLALAALGIVYGDIGTSPLYALKEVFAGAHPVPITPPNVFGILSLVEVPAWQDGRTGLLLTDARL